MKPYEVVEITGARTKKFALMFFESDKEMTKYLNNKKQWNSDNTHYSITGWRLDSPEIFINYAKYGYKESVSI